MGALDGMLAARLAELTGRHPSTVRRWLRTQHFPSWVWRLERFTMDLGAVAPPWCGWSLHRDTLRSPEGWLFTPAELRSVPFMHAQIAAYQARERTHLQADWIEERYVEPLSARA